VFTFLIRFYGQLTAAVIIVVRKHVTFGLVLSWVFPVSCCLHETFGMEIYLVHIYKSGNHSHNILPNK